MLPSPQSTPAGTGSTYETERLPQLVASELVYVPGVAAAIWTMPLTRASDAVVGSVKVSTPSWMSRYVIVGYVAYDWTKTYAPALHTVHPRAGPVARPLAGISKGRRPASAAGAGHETPESTGPEPPSLRGVLPSPEPPSGPGPLAPSVPPPPSPGPAGLLPPLPQAGAAKTRRA